MGPERLPPLVGHSTTVFNIPRLGSVALILWGLTNEKDTIRFAHLIVLKSLQCHKVVTNIQIRTVIHIVLI